MTNIQVEWTGLQHLIDDIRGLPKEVAKEVQKAQEEDLRDVASLLANYPPVHFGQHYIRTGRLGFGWLEAKAKSRLLGDLGFEVFSQIIRLTPGRSRAARATKTQSRSGSLGKGAGRAWTMP
jgi:hypothetical protein